jgi:hypothetical protein
MKEAGRPERRMTICRSGLVLPSSLGLTIKESRGSAVCGYQFRQAALACIQK